VYFFTALVGVNWKNWSKTVDFYTSFFTLCGLMVVAAIIMHKYDTHMSKPGSGKNSKTPKE
jgi:hypothetical protein